ncbi:hypothetical protein DQG13_08405 [Paenibacillus sp. YN15]|nr:hypothetical protein DQG13_08405 [Paenibacillus sp. YN15]
MSPVISVKEWMLTLLLMLIPLVNFVMWFVFAFGEGNRTKKNLFKAMLLLYGIILGFFLLIGVLAFLLSFSNELLS